MTIVQKYCTPTKYIIFYVFNLLLYIRPDQINMLGHRSDRPSFFTNSKKKNSQTCDHSILVFLLVNFCLTIWN